MKSASDQLLIIIEIELVFNNTVTHVGKILRTMAKAQDVSGRQFSAKGQLARQKLKAAVIAVLDRSGYHELKITDVTEEAGVATGLFYHYFPDLKTLVLEVLEEFIKSFEAMEEIEKGVAKGDWFGRLYAHFYKEVKSFADHPGLSRCLEFFAETDAEFRNLWRDSFDWQLQRLVDVIPGVFPESQLDDAEKQLLVYSLSGLGREVLKRYYIEKEETLGGANLSPEEMAEWLSVMYYRGLFAANPPKGSLRFADKVLNIQK